MARYDDIAAYVFAADLYCPSCMTEIARGLEHPHVFIVRGVGADANTESVLDALADAWSVDRHAEETFDSDQFPKVAFADQLRSESEYPLEDESGGETADRCGRCGRVLAE